jgi:glucokinase
LGRVWLKIKAAPYETGFLLAMMSQNNLENPWDDNAATSIGIDIGGTKMNAALVGPESREFWLQPENEESALEIPAEFLINSPTPAQSGLFLSTLSSMIEKLAKGRAEGNYKVSSIGIATAGVVDSENGRVLGSTGNMPALRDLGNLRESMERQLSSRGIHIPIHIENDANAAAYGEWRCGAGAGSRNMFAITLGTGVGMGIVFDGRLYRGSHFYAGEGGHIAIDYHRKRQCTCGRWDCWEAFASGRGLQTTAERLVTAAPESSRREFLTKFCTDDVVTTYAVMAAAQVNNHLGAQIVDEWHHHIAVGLGSLINVMDPDRIVVGGGLAKFVNFDLLTERTRERTISNAFQLVPARLGNYAGIIGAACLAMENVNSKEKTISQGSDKALSTKISIA